MFVSVLPVISDSCSTPTSVFLRDEAMLEGACGSESGSACDKAKNVPFHLQLLSSIVEHQQSPYQGFTPNKWKAVFCWPVSLRAELQMDLLVRKMSRSYDPLHIKSSLPSACLLSFIHKLSQEANRQPTPPTNEETIWFSCNCMWPAHSFLTTYLK